MSRERAPLQANPAPPIDRLRTIAKTFEPSVTLDALKVIGNTVGIDDWKLTGANLTGANLTGAKLTGANLSRANLSRANLIEAKLTGANLTGADLSRANLIEAKLTGANLTGAKLTGANLGDWERDPNGFARRRE